LATAAFALTACGGDSGRRSYTFGNGDALPPAIVMPAPTGHVSRNRENRALRIATRDAAFNALLRDTSHSLSASEPWGGIDGKPLGVALTYTLRRPLAVDADLPYAEIPPDAPAHGDCVQPYADGWLHLRAARVTVVTVLVDLRRGRVADISTNATSGEIRPLPGKPYPSCGEDGFG
jgi:hypothetical protein